MYQEKVQGNPIDLVRVYQEGSHFYVIRNDDSRTEIPKDDIVSKNEDKIAEALNNFTLID